MSTSDDYLDQLAKMVEEARQKQASQNDEPSLEEPANSSLSEDTEDEAVAEDFALPVPTQDEVFYKPKHRSVDDEDDQDFSKSKYYAPGSMLEGQARTDDIELPEDWENSGKAFDIKRGRHEALIEGVWSEEIDGPLAVKKHSKNKIIAAVFVLILLISLPVSFMLAKQNTSPTPEQAPPASGDPLKDFRVVLTNELGKKVPSKATIGENVAFQGLTNNITGTTLKAKGFEFEASTDQCRKTYIEANQPCFLGTLKDKDFTYNTYYLHDAVHSKIFTPMAELEPAKVKGAVYSASTVIEFTGKPTRLLLVIAEGNSGFFIEMPNDFDVNAVVGLSEYIKIAKGNNK